MNVYSDGARNSVFRFRPPVVALSAALAESPCTSGSFHARSVGVVARFSLQPWFSRTLKLGSAKGVDFVAEGGKEGRKMRGGAF